MRREKVRPSRGSHLPVLLKLLQLTTGPILELGCGNYSTPFLHWWCYTTKRRLVTYEDSPQFYDYLKGFANDYHEIHFVPDWDAIDVSEPWGVAFVDHGRRGGRHIETAKLTHAEYVVVHDTERRSDGVYHLSLIEHLFKYRYHYSAAFPETTVYSNVHDLRTFAP